MSRSTRGGNCIEQIYKISDDRTIRNSAKESLTVDEFDHLSMADTDSVAARSEETKGGDENEKKKNTTNNEPGDDEAKTSNDDGTGIRDVDFKHFAELKEAFRLFDVDRDGFIDKADLKLTFISLGNPDVTDQQLDDMLAETSNSIDLDAFVQLFGFKATQLDPEEALLSALSTWDYEGNGMISEERIRHDLRKLGDRFTERDVDRALEEAPLYKKDGVTMIDYVKFCSNICGLRKVETCRKIEKEAEVLEQRSGTLE